MSKIFKNLTGPLVSLFFLLNMTSVGYAETTVSAEVSFIFNTFLFLVCGFLVMFMAAGFAMLEAGMVTSKSVSVICAKNIGLFSIAGIMFWMFGYNLAYGIPEGGYIGKFIPWSDASKIDTGYSDGSDWYFQMVFCATTVSIVSGTMAERIKLWPFIWNNLSNCHGLAMGRRMVSFCWIFRFCRINFSSFYRRSCSPSRCNFTWP